MSGRSRVVAALVASALLVPPAFAQPAAKDRKKAEGLVKQAIAKSQAKDHAGAIDLYLKAYAIVPLASLLSNIGTEYQHDQQQAEALKYFCMYLEKEPEGPLASYATTQVTTLEGELGDRATTARCKPLPPPPPPAPPDPPPVEDGPVANVDTGPGDPGRTLKLSGLVIGGLGVAAFGVGAYFGIRSIQIDSEVDDHPINERWPDDVEDLDGQGRRANQLAWTGMIAGGVLVAGGAALYLLGRSKTSEVTVTPVATPAGAGVMLGGSF